MKNKIALCLTIFLIFSCCYAGPLRGSESGDLPSTPEFRLGPEDVLKISVWKDEALTHDVVVRPDGKISFPLIGDIVAEGQTVESLQRALQDKIQEFVPDAPVTVMVLRVGSPKVYVVGKVAKPGVYVMGQKLRILQLLAMAGGMTTFADKGDVLIIRSHGSEQQVLKFDYDKMADGKDLDQNILLQRGDTILVP